MPCFNSGEIATIRMSENSNIVIQTQESKTGCLALLLIAIFIIGIVIGCMVHRNYDRRQEEKIATKTDTTYIYDTVRVSSPVEVIYKKTTDTLLVPKRDTIMIRDTVYMVLKKEVKEYRDSSYYAKVSGYRPSLDYIEVYPRTTVITNTERIAPDKNGIAVGLEASFVEKFYLPIYIEYERRLHKNVGARARLLYDLPSKSIGAGAGIYVDFGW
jgi:hypothetical protein